MDIRERLSIELSKEERATHEVVQTVLEMLNVKGYGAVIVFGQNMPDDPQTVTASIKYTKGLTRDGLVTLMTALNNHATTLLEDTHERQAKKDQNPEGA